MKNGATTAQISGPAPMVGWVLAEPFSTLNALLILHELKVSRTHEAIRGALRLLLNASRDDGRYRLAPGGMLAPCYTAAAARVLCRFSYAKDRRLQRTISHLLETQYDDGGWRCNKFPYGRGPETKFSNPGVTLPVLDIFRFTDHVNKDPRLASRGRVVVERPHRKLAALQFCAKGKPSDLATYRYREVMNNLRK